MKLLIQHNQEIAQLSPDPFPLLRVGSGNETMYNIATHCCKKLAWDIFSKARMRAT